MLNSRQIMEGLRKSVIGQDEYVRQLSILGYRHQLNQVLIKQGKTPLNNNLLVVGPSGSGKTFGARKLSEIVDIPFYEADCSNIVQTGYRGLTSVENILSDAVHKLGSGVQHCIIYLDEFDKIFDQALERRGEGSASQQNFLKMLEPNELVFDRSSSRFSDSKARTLNTAGITFIATGSFDFVHRKAERNTLKMGFDRMKAQRRVLSKEDIIRAGFIPELVGRFSTLVNLNELNEEDYYRILSEGKDSAYTRYIDFFKAAEVDLCIDPDALRMLAREAFAKKSGARGIHDVLNACLDDCVFDVSCDLSIREVKILPEEERIVSRYVYGKKRESVLERETQQDAGLHLNLEGV